MVGEKVAQPVHKGAVFPALKAELRHLGKRFILVVADALFFAEKGESRDDEDHEEK